MPSSPLKRATAPASLSMIDSPAARPIMKTEGVCSSGRLACREDASMDDRDQIDQSQGRFLSTLSLHDAETYLQECFGHAQNEMVLVYGDDRSPALSRSEEHTSELQSPTNLVCRLLLEKKKK